MIAPLWLATTLFIITFEEPTVRSKFGGDYAAYCRNVRRWIPRLRPFDDASDLVR
jgi:protein-S-isoprenylcysteine O-methyltransferase Ste14